MPKIRVTIEKGKVNHDVIGGVGPSCQNYTRPYLEALKIPETDVSREAKPEMHLTEGEHVNEDE
jgi:hypothetical protein